MPLTQYQITNAKPRDKQYKLSDGEGLYLFVQPNGSKWWRFRYFFDKKEKMLSVGTFPEVTLAEARTKREDARKLVSKGIDPSAQRKTDKIAASVAASNTFGAIAKERLKKSEDEGASVATLKKNRWLLEDLASPLAGRPITEIKPAEVLQLLQGIERTGRRETAHRLREVIGSVFRLAIFPSVCMEFDHRDHSQKSDRVTRLAQFSLRRMYEEIEKCDLVCANCHRIRTFKRNPLAHIAFFETMGKKLGNAANDNSENTDLTSA